jgi:hypothetical protein
VRALKVLVVVMGVLIVAGTVTLVTLIVQRAGRLAGGGEAGRTSAPDATGRFDLSLDQPEGTRISGVAAVEGAGGLLAVWVTRPDGSQRVLLVDARRGRVAGEVRAAPAAR